MEGHPRAWIFTSATLAVGSSDFGHYCGELGLIEPPIRGVGQPLRLRKAGVLYAPQGMPDPQQPALPGSGGGSRLAGADPRLGRPRLRAVHLLRAMRRIHELLQEKLEPPKGSNCRC
jgi:ATP-dependent DNA helicase DinG